MTEIRCAEGELQVVAEKVIKKGKDHSIWCFIGDLGTGKTSLIKEICNHLGVIDVVKSPTYNIINEYLTDSGKKIYHFDFYRIDNIEEALDIGTEEYFYSEELCLVEWPEIVEPLLPQEFLSVEIQYLDMERVYLIKEND